ncbi:hypothetical protein, partial [Streptomyces eurythermus]
GEYNRNYINFDKYILKYMKKSPNELVEESHMHSTWLKNREAILRQVPIEYELEDLSRDFAI